MRELSPAINASAEEFLETLPLKIQQRIAEIRRQKQAGERPLPSNTLEDRSVILTKSHRAQLLDSVAALVDESLGGRSDMCLQFADLLNRALNHLHFPAHPVVGTAMYYDARGAELFRWRHAWVRIGDEVVDGNVDCLSENPLVPETIRIAPYWGPISQTPNDRRLREDRGDTLPSDGDVSEIWWPELKKWLETVFSAT